MPDTGTKVLDEISSWFWASSDSLVLEIMEKLTRGMESSGISGMCGSIKISEMNQGESIKKQVHLRDLSVT